MRALQTFCKFSRKMKNRPYLRVLLNRMMIDFNVFEIYESSQGDFLEVCRFVETGRSCVGRPPSQISCCYDGGVVDSEEIYFVFFLRYPSPDNFQSNFQLCFPSFCGQLGCVLRGGATLILSSESRASSRRIIDICEEKLSLWANLKFIIMLRIAFEGGYENLNYVFLIQWIVAVLIS